MLPTEPQMQPFKAFFKIVFLKNFAKFTRHHQYWSPFLNKIPDFSKLIKKESLAQVLSFEIYEIFKDTSFTEQLRATVSRFFLCSIL